MYDRRRRGLELRIGELQLAYDAACRRRISGEGTEAEQCEALTEITLQRDALTALDAPWAGQVRENRKAANEEALADWCKLEADLDEIMSPLVRDTEEVIRRIRAEALEAVERLACGRVKARALFTGRRLTKRVELGSRTAHWELNNRFNAQLTNARATASALSQIEDAIHELDSIARQCVEEVKPILRGEDA